MVYTTRSTRTNPVIHYVTQKITTTTTTSIENIKDTILVATALTLALHSEESNVYTFSIREGRLNGTITIGETTIGALLLELKKVKKVGNDGVDRSRIIYSTEINDSASYDEPLVLLVDTTSLKLYFDPELFSTSQATWYLSHLTTAFQALCTLSPTALLSEVPFINAEELALINSFTNSPPSPSSNYYPPSCTTLPSFILHACELYPEATALVFDSTSYTYLQLLHLSTLFAQHLIKSRVKPGSIVPICITKSVEMIFSMLGILLAGGGYLCFEPTLPGKRQEGILNELKRKRLLSRVGIVQSEQKEMWSDWKVFEQVVNPIEFFKDLLSLSPSSSIEEALHLSSSTSLPILDPSDTAYVVFTSGSSGTPKGIQISHSNVSSFLKNYRGVFGREVGERILQFPSYSFDVSVMSIWDTLSSVSSILSTLLSTTH